MRAAEAKNPSAVAPRVSRDNEAPDTLSRNYQEPDTLLRQNPEPDTRFGEPERATPSADLRNRLISEAAYRLYVERGCTDGHDVEDWLQAEAEVDHIMLNRRPSAEPTG
jgi:hypothetical protein